MGKYEALEPGVSQVNNALKDTKKDSRYGTNIGLAFNT
jgi:hypothetical protein